MSAAAAIVERFRESFPRELCYGCARRPSAWRAMQGGGREGVRMQGNWYCGPACFEKAAASIFSVLVPAAKRRRVKHHRVPIGLVLFSLGLITQENLKAALQAQRETGGRLGALLRQHGAVNEEQVTAALAMQWSRPVFPIETQGRMSHCAHLIPLPILEAARIVPVHYLQPSKVLYMAFVDSIDHSALYGIEQMLDCRTETCLAPESSLDRAIEDLRHQERPPEFLFDSVFDPAEMAATARSYALQLGADEVRVVGCGEYIWVRFESKNKFNNLLFQIVPR